MSHSDDKNPILWMTQEKSRFNFSILKETRTSAAGYNFLAGNYVYELKSASRQHQRRYSLRAFKTLSESIVVRRAIEYCC